VVDIGGVRQGVSELPQAVYTKPLGVCYGFAAVFNLIFDYPNFWEGVPLVGRRWYRWIGSW